MPMSAAESEILDQITLDAPWSLVESFAGMQRWRPEDVNTGADLIVQRLRALGIPVEVHEPTVFLSVPNGDGAWIMLDGERHRAKAPSSAFVVPQGVTGEMVYLPANLKALRSYAKSIAELFGRPESDAAELAAMVKGRILVTEGFGNPALTRFAEEWGAIGLVAINPGVDIHWGTCTTVWGTPDLTDLPRKPRIPVVAVAKPTGEVLKKRAASRAKVTLHTDLVEGWFPQKIPVVHIPGTREPDRFVLVHGHYDSWDVGVGDNATGDATLLELARLFWSNRDKLVRSVRLAWWPGHSTGRYAGSTWFADRFAIDLDENCVAQVNCDSPGCRWATSYHQTVWTTEMAGHVKAAIADVEGGSTTDWRRPPRAGDYAFSNIGISSYFMLSSTMPEALRHEKNYYDVSGCGANIAWHTENDTLEIADKGTLMTDMRIYALAVLRHANARILPVDWRAALDEFSETIARYEQASKGLADLGPAREAVASLRGALDGFHSRIAAGTAGPDAANEALLRLARILIPVNYAREPRFRHDPAYNVPPLPTLSVAEDMAHLPEDQLGFARTELMRGQNRFVAALRECERIVRRA
jgi:hypothetical protein